MRQYDQLVLCCKHSGNVNFIVWRDHTGELKICVTNSGNGDRDTVGAVETRKVMKKEYNARLERLYGIFSILLIKPTMYSHSFHTTCNKILKNIIHISSPLSKDQNLQWQSHIWHQQMTTDIWRQQVDIKQR